MSCNFQALADRVFLYWKRIIVTNKVGTYCGQDLTSFYEQNVYRATRSEVANRELFRLT